MDTSVTLPAIQKVTGCNASGAENRCDMLDWSAVPHSVKSLQVHLAKVVCHNVTPLLNHYRAPQMAIGAAFWVFELYEAKVSRTVLWGGKPCEGLTYPPCDMKLL
jgi:hypothetical protein